MARRRIRLPSAAGLGPTAGPGARHCWRSDCVAPTGWIPAFAGMTGKSRTTGKAERGEAVAGSKAARIGGFTLIELMVVLVILGLLAGLVGPQLFGRIDSSKVQTAETQIKMLRGALQAYRLDVGRYPSTEEGLAALVRPPAEKAEYWNGPYLEDEVPPDPWNTSYRYESPADNLQGFALYSLGADSEEGGEGVDAEVGYLPVR